MKKLFIILLSFTVSAILYGCDTPRKDVSAEYAKELLIYNKDVIVLDVRTAAEFAAGHLPNAINIDVNDDSFKTKLQDLNKEGEYLVYCFVGIRSLKASKIMTETGFKKIYNLEDGIKNWSESVQ